MRDPRRVIWEMMVHRCTRPRSHAYARYGGRGITVCERWLKFENFAADMGIRPDGMTLERVDNDGPYSPSNCVWASRKAQSNNRRNNVWLEHGGRRLTIAQWARELGVDRQVVRKRLLAGWTVSRAVTEPARRQGRSK